jgi:hypothetical protein
MTFSYLNLVSVIIQTCSWKKCNELMHNTNQVFDIVLFCTSHKIFHLYLKVDEDLIFLAMRLVLASPPFTPDCSLLYSDSFCKPTHFYYIYFFILFWQGSITYISSFDFGKVYNPQPQWILWHQPLGNIFAATLKLPYAKNVSLRLSPDKNVNNEIQWQ